MKKNNFFIYYRFILIMLLFAIVAWLPRVVSMKGNTFANKSSSFHETAPEAKKKIVFIAGACSHGPGEHEHNAGCKLLAGEINKNMSDVAEAIVFQGWPTDTTVLNDASTIVMYMDGGGGHLAL